MAERYVLDASALLCMLNEEPGAGRVETVLDDAVISAVNVSEIVAKIVERGGTSDMVAAILDPLHLEIVDFDRSQAITAGQLRVTTRHAGLSLGDRARLALAVSRELAVLTADWAWRDLDLPIRIELLR